jgi:HSP20 family protein
MAKKQKVRQRRPELWFLDGPLRRQANRSLIWNECSRTFLGVDCGRFSQNGGGRLPGMEITTPAVDLYEEQDEIVVKAELPGMEKDNIEVNLSDDGLTIKGEKK